MQKFILYLFIGTILTACVSSKKYYQRGQYDSAIRQAVKKLRKKPTKEKEILILEQAYTKANERDRGRIDFLKLEGSPDMWDEVYNRYSKMKERQSLVKSVIPLEIMSTGRIVQFKIINYDEEIINSKKNAAEYFYAHALTLLEKGDRENAKRAYFEFKRVRELYPNFKEVDDMLKKSKYMATLKVIAEPIPMHSQNFKLTNEFFDNKINEFLGQMPASEFVRFYTREEARNIGLEDPNHILQMVFDDFVVGQVYIKEKETRLIKENVIMGIKDGNKLKTGNDKVTICHNPKSEKRSTLSISVSAWEGHAKHGDHLGGCKVATPEGETKPGTGPSVPEVIYGTVKATTFITTKSLISKGLLDFKIIDANTNKVLTQEKFPGTFVWTCHWGYFNGNGRALSPKDHKAMKGKQVAPPPSQQLFIEFTKPIYDQLTVKIKNFYRNY